MATFLFVNSPQGTGAFTLQGPDATVKTTGGKQHGTWNLWTNGKIGEFIQFNHSGHYLLQIQAKGSLARKAGPKMVIKLDSTPHAETYVNSSRFRKYTFPLQAGKGIYHLTIEFTNDLLTETEDRNLYIKKIAITPLEHQDDPVLSDAKSWAQQYGKRQVSLETQILAQAEKSIKKIRQEDVRIIVTDDATGKPVPGIELRAVQQNHTFLFGCNIHRFNRFRTDEENVLYKKRFVELFNYATTGFYWASYEHIKGRPTYRHTDEIVHWCQSNDIRVKGHALLWDHPHGIPKWAGTTPPPEHIQKKRVMDIVRRYSEAIDFWEVVNESGNLPDLELDRPYRWARTINPNAALIVNDFGVFIDNHFNFKSLLQQAILRGVPFDAVGFQAHEPTTMRFPLPTVWKTLESYAKLGKKIHITEFTPTSAGQDITGSHIQGIWDEKHQADYAEKFYTLFSVIRQSKPSAGGI
ncbi:MAG: hypothetical protein GY697_27815 [Desulfobacterales bacterium]|nr:hypothetical protein [Desulfobacterales bacterium]